MVLAGRVSQNSAMWAWPEQYGGLQVQSGSLQHVTDMTCEGMTDMASKKHNPRADWNSNTVQHRGALQLFTG